jgi:hypothetical protein
VARVLGELADELDRDVSGHLPPLDGKILMSLAELSEQSFSAIRSSLQHLPGDRKS